MGRIVEVDDELYKIILWMKRNAMINRAIRNFAKAFIGKARFENTPIEELESTAKQ